MSNLGHSETREKGRWPILSLVITVVLRLVSQADLLYACSVSHDQDANLSASSDPTNWSTSLTGPFATSVLASIGASAVDSGIKILPCAKYIWGASKNPIFQGECLPRG